MEINFTGSLTDSQFDRGVGGVHCNVTQRRDVERKEGVIYERHLIGTRCTVTFRSRFA
jgi:hypothetical protein